MRKLIFITLIIFSSSKNVFANSITDKLKHVAEEIANTKSQLESKQQAVKALHVQLKETEVKIGDTSNRLKNANERYQSTQHDISALQSKAQKLSEDLKVQLMLYTEQLQAAYMITPQSQIKLVLNQQDPNQIDRYLAYANYLNDHQEKVIKKLKETKQNLHITQEELTKKSNQIKQQKVELEGHHAALQQQYGQRKVVLSSLSQQISSKQLHLAELAKNKQHLEDILDKLTQSTVTNKYQAFHQGQLPWPTQGVITTEFGSPIEQSQMHWNGVIIAAKENEPVIAVGPGKVVFADWMAGYGLVLIIDHGNGYMTVYGRNSTLYKERGDKVSGGEMIAHVGQSGGFDKPTLYFSIRHNAKALNPRIWCVKHG